MHTATPMDPPPDPRHPPGWACHSPKSAPLTSPWPSPNCPQTPCHPFPSAQDRRVYLRGLPLLSCRTSDHVRAKPSLPVIHCQRAVHPGSSPPNMVDLPTHPSPCHSPVKSRTAQGWGIFSGGHGHFWGAVPHPNPLGGFGSREGGVVTDKRVFCSRVANQPPRKMPVARP
jgi:hypothetical protein